MRRSWKAICVALALSLGGHAGTALAQGQGPYSYYSPNMAPQMMPPMMAAQLPGQPAPAMIPADAMPPAGGAGMGYPGPYAGAPMPPGMGGGMAAYGGGAPMPPGAGSGMVYYPGASMGPPAGDGGGYGGDGGGGGGNCCCDCCGYFVRGDVLWLDRTNGNSHTVAINDPGGGTGFAVLDSNQANFNYRPGMRLFAGRTFSNGVRLEAGYFGLQHNTSAAGFNAGAGAGTVSVPFAGAGFANGLFPVGFVNVDSAQFVYTSDIHNAEFNIARNFLQNDTFWLSNLIGFRYLYLQEKFNLSGSDAVGTSLYNIKTTNNLIGGQIGTEAGVKVTPRLSFDTWAKVGVFGNADVQSSSINDSVAGGVINSQTQHGQGVSTVIDLGINGTFAVTRRISGHAGYNLLFISGLALAPDQLDFTVTSTSQSHINDSGNTTYFGPSAGFDVSW